MRAGRAVALLTVVLVAGCSDPSAAAATATAEFLDREALAAETVDVALGQDGSLSATRDLPAGRSRTVVTWPAGVCWAASTSTATVEGTRVVVEFAEDTSGQDACDAAQVPHGGVVVVEADAPVTLDVRARH